MTTMRDVAALSNVSAKTVSRVFNDDPHVLPETRARVEAALRQLNYVPNALARDFRTGRAPAIGIAVPDLVDPFFAAIIQAVDHAAAARDLSTVVTSLGDDPAREATLVESLLRRQLSGLIIAPVSTEHAYLRQWATRVPLVFVDRSPVHLAADSFTEDDHGGAYLATTHLLEHGHRRIAFVGDAFGVTTTANRFAGYRAALADRGIALDNTLLAIVPDRDTAPAAMVDLFTRGAPSAIFSSNARTSMALVPALKNRHVALVGFGDFPMADVLTPALTVIDQDPTALGALAARRLFDRADRPDKRFRRRTVLPVRLVERESCGVHAVVAARPDVA